jgi:hypothetical protein
LGNSIPVTSESEFERLLDHLGAEARHASDYWFLLRGLDTELEAMNEGFNQCEVFWGFVFHSLQDATVSRLCRLYDPHKDVLSLRRFLETVKKKLDYFSKDAFRRRVSNHPDVDGLVSKYQPPDTSKLNTEISSVTESDECVKRVVDLRNNFVAHRNADRVRLQAFASLPGLTNDEVGMLLKRARDLVAKYDFIYRRRLVSIEVSGADDYRHLLTLITKGQASILAEIEEDYPRARTRVQAP